MTRCPPICGKRKQEEKKSEVKKVERGEDEEVLKKLVPKRFWRWKKVFGKKESERMLVRKAWDHAIELKEGFTPKKGKVYSLSREEREEVQASLWHSFFFLCTFSFSFFLYTFSLSSFLCVFFSNLFYFCLSSCWQSKASVSAHLLASLALYCLSLGSERVVLEVGTKDMVVKFQVESMQK